MTEDSDEFGLLLESLVRDLGKPRIDPLKPLHRIKMGYAALSFDEEISICIYSSSV